MSCCLKCGRKTLVVVEGSRANSVHVIVSSSPASFQTKLGLHGGESEYVPVNLFDSGPLISSIVEVVVRDGTGKVLNTCTLVPRSLAPYKEIRIAVDSPFRIRFVLAPAGFWINVLRSFSFRFGTKKNVNRPRRPIDIESQVAPNLSQRIKEDSSILGSPIKDQELDEKSSASDAHCIESDLSERMSNDSSILDYPIDEESDNKSSVSHGHCIEVIIDENSIGFSTEASSFRSCRSPSEENNAPEENVPELEARSSSLVGSILDFSKRFMGVINYIE